MLSIVCINERAGGPAFRLSVRTNQTEGAPSFAESALFPLRSEQRFSLGSQALFLSGEVQENLSL